MFLTAEDPRARIRGSRDPLGVQPIWTDFGRQVIANLTTVTTSVREFSVLLLGRYFAERLVAEEAIEEEEALNVFLRIEQLAGYARYLVHGAESVRGITRVKRFTSESNRVTISADTRHMILTDQRVYGIWGLYTAAGRASGLLPHTEIGVEAIARDFIEQAYLPALESQWGKLRQLAIHGGELPARGSNAIFQAVANALGPELSSAERDFWPAVLRDAAHAGVESAEVAHRQSQLARLMQTYLDGEAPLDRVTVQSLAEAAETVSAALAERLRRIDRLEALLVPTDLAFQLLIARHGQWPARVAETLADAWGESGITFRDNFDNIAPIIEQSVGPEQCDLLCQANHALADGDYTHLVDTLLEWNQLVMSYRGSAPWVRRGADGRLDVRHRGREPQLPDPDEMAERLDNEYFLSSLASITFEIQTGQV